MARDSTKQETTRPDGVYMADGTYIRAEAGVKPPDFWIRFFDRQKDGDFLKYAVIFSNVAKTARFTCVYAGGRQTIVWEGYTRMVAILTDGGGRLNIRMRKEDEG